jgi:pantetheine-phosphate adenylyltransferase
MRKAVYAGSFDPITNGHLWIIRQAAPLFDSLVIAIGINPDKKTTFPLAERLRFVAASISDIPNCTVDSFENQYLVDYAARVGAGTIIRGIRNESDFTYERAMRHINGDLRPEILTLFFVPPREIAEISSSMVKGMVGPDGWRAIVRRYVPPCVFEAFQTHQGVHHA